MGLTWDFADTSLVDRFASKMKPKGGTKLVWIETPTNPLLKVRKWIASKALCTSGLVVHGLQV